MIAVGIRELKARLSHYLREVEKGEIVLVTDRGRVVAEVRTPGSAPQERSAVDRALQRLAEGGGLLLGEPHDPRAYSASPLRTLPGTSTRLLAEEREEG
jgi:antitoxin (DNA-binding transcriptional repressor) of toxin-antitoxin stability system